MSTGGERDPDPAHGPSPALMTADEMTVRLRESHHRIKNHLQLVAGLLAIQARDAGDPRVSEPLRDAQRRVLAIARLQEQFQAVGDSAEVEIARFLTRLCVDLDSSLGGAVKFRPRIETARLSTDRAVAVALVMTELATNAAKHAYAGGQGEVRIDLERWAGGWRLTVADDGPGFPGEDPAAMEGVGLQILRMLVRKLKGSLSANRVDHGASLSLYFI